MRRSFARSALIVDSSPPGGTSTVSASLKPGTYKYYCPFDSHEQEGMTGTLTVK